MITLNTKAQTDTPQKAVAYLRFILDTLGEYFIYEEASGLKQFAPIYMCGVTQRMDRALDVCCHGPLEGIDRSRWPKISRSDIRVHHRSMSDLKRVVAGRNIRLFHAQFLTDAYYFLPLIKVSRLPLIVSLRGYDLFAQGMRKYLSAVLPFTSMFLVKSASMQEALISSGCNPERIKVIYGGVNT